MNIKTNMRIALLVNWLDIVVDDSAREKIRNELWCLRNGISTVGLEDVTMSNVSVTQLHEIVMESSPLDRHEQAALILCTFNELS